MVSTETLSIKHDEFISKLFLLKFNATKAYAETYPDNKTPRFSASLLLTNINIKAEIERRKAAVRAEHIADRAERKRFWTKTMKTASNMTDRLRASELLGKSECDFITVNYDLVDEQQLLDKQQQEQARLIAEQIVLNANRSKLIESKEIENVQG